MTTRRYLVDSQQVVVDWLPNHASPYYRIRVTGRPLAGRVEKTALGRYQAIMADGQVVGSYLGLREAVAVVVRAERPEA